MPATMIDRCVTPSERADLAARSDLVLAVAEPIAELARSFGAGRTEIIPGSVDDPPGGWDRPIERPSAAMPTICSASIPRSAAR